METLDSPNKPAIWARLRNSRGFSLVEMAIVLVIIGIIIAAIIKGQDLITNSRAKQLTAAASSFRIAAFTYLDRNGRFPGDGGDRNGIIGDQVAAVGPPVVVGEQVATTSAIAEMEGSITTLPANPVSVGGMSFWFFLGNAVKDTAAQGSTNVIVICKDPTCQIPLTSDEKELLIAVDTAFDGSNDHGVGTFRSAVAAGITLAGGATPLAVTPGGRANDVVTTATAVKATGAWDNTTDVAAVWAFDRTF